MLSALQSMSLKEDDNEDDAKQGWMPVIPVGSEEEIEELRQKLLLHDRVPTPDYMGGKCVSVCTDPNNTRWFSGPDFVFYSGKWMTLELFDHHVSGVFDPRTTNGEQLTAHWNRMTGLNYKLILYDLEQRQLFLSPP